MAGLSRTPAGRPRMCALRWHASPRPSPNSTASGSTWPSQAAPCLPIPDSRQSDQSARHSGDRRWCTGPINAADVVEKRLGLSVIVPFSLYSLSTIHKLLLIYHIHIDIRIFPYNIHIDIVILILIGYIYYIHIVILILIFNIDILILLFLLCM